MEEFIAFFETMATDIPKKMGWVISCLVFTWVLEAIIPLVRHDYNKWKHDGINMIFFLFTALINLLIGIMAISVFVWIENGGFGLLNWINLPLWAELAIAVLALDLFAQYGIHYFLHRIKWMWKMHMVHHSDTKVDATTGTRHHPGDYFLRELVGLGTVLIFGIPVAFWAFYRIVTIFFTYMTHANIRLPYWMDKTLSFIFITPNIHKFHHHFERPWTDTNFGNVFSIWDRLFGTLVYDDPKKIKFGLDVLEGEKDEDIMYQLKLPFNDTVQTDY